MTTDLLHRYGRPVPRYTSYPTAPHFTPEIGAETYASWLDAAPRDAALSLYVHVPFCDRLCWFCGCHTKQTRRYEPVATYVRTLHAEIDMVARTVGAKGRVTSVHWGGGSPTMLRPDDIRALMAALRGRFAFSADAEISIEIDPNDMDADRAAAIAAAGFNRASLGVQDFDPAVQRAINRDQSYDQTARTVAMLRRNGVRAINLDLLYGLPHQTEKTILATARQALSLMPDRIALFGYAHVPWIKKHQTLIDAAALPDLDARFAQAEAAAQVLVEAGLVRIGIDHFARPGDSLAQAARTGRLRRNFQGYTTDQADHLIGLGASAIGRTPSGYTQNVVATGAYMAAVGAGHLPVAKGVALTEDDRMRGHAIERLMCDFALSVPDLTRRFGPRAATIVAEAEAFIARNRDGLMVRDGDRYRVTEAGRPFVRHLAAVFDAYLDPGTARHSLAV